MLGTLGLKRLFPVILALGVAAFSGWSPAFAQVPPAASRTVSDILQQLDLYKPDPAGVAKLLAEFNAPAPDTDDSGALARYYHQRARLAQSLGLADERINALETALPYARRARLPASAEGGSERRILSDLASAWAARDYRKAIAYAEELLGDPKLSHGYYLGESTKIANIYTSLGDFEMASRMIARAEKRLVAARKSRDWAAYGSGWRSYVEQARAYNLRQRGKLIEAEQLLRSAIALVDEDLRTRSSRVERGLDTRTQSSMLGERDTLVRSLAVTFQRTGRLEEAEVLMRDALKEKLARDGRRSAEVGNQLRALSGIIADEGRGVEALQLARYSVQVFSEIGQPKATFNSLWTSQTYAGLLAGVGRYAESVRVFEALRADVAGDSRLSARFGSGTRSWAYALMKTGRVPEAIAMLAKVVEEDDKALGPGHVESAFARAYLGMAYAASGDRASAYRELHRGFAVLAGADGGQLEYIRRSVPATRRLALVGGAYIKLLSEMRGTPLEGQSGIDAAAEAFRASDVVRGQVVVQAVAASAARAAADSPQLAEMIRTEQDLTQEAEALYRFLIGQLSEPPERQLPKVIADMRTRIAAVERRRRALAKELQNRFPAYADFVNPRAPTLAQARAALHEGEVLLSVLSTPDGSFVWAVPRTGAMVFHSSALTSVALKEQVAALRKALDVGDRTLENFPVFDVSLAHDIYRELLEPTEGVWRDARSLLVAVSGPLSQLPFSLLPTGPAAPVVNRAPSQLLFENYKAVPWLIKRIAVAQIPSVNSLLTLRAMPESRGERQSFAGFGDPVFAPRTAEIASAASTARSAKLAARTVVRNLAVTRVTDEALQENRPVDWIPYSTLPRLPDTRDEVLAIAKALNADPERDVFLGPDASKMKLASMDLSVRKIVAFATHGLLPGDFPGVDEPALALSAPPGGADADPRIALLTTDDILRLKLDADWVVLSACNSAAGEGKGSDAISGLGRAFFYAGSRALLVTHWPVETRSARLLVAGVFERYASDTSITRAEALRRSMLAVMENRSADVSGTTAYSYAHPMFWAPYALVGDSGR